MQDQGKKVIIKKRNIKLNMAINALKGALGVVFPLITFPYVSKVLQVENVGKYNFAASVISYFLLIASLGISTYAVREGAKYRENREQLNRFANEIFTINMVTTAVSYILLFALLIYVPKFKSYRELLLILSLEIIFKTIGMDWIYSIYEDYIYITVRSIIFQVLSLLLLFLLVHKKEDYVIYAGITVFASVGANILNYFRSKKYCKVRLTWNFDWKKHLKPILVFFATTLATTIYVSSDTTMLGLFCGDYSVGIYSVAVKVYNIVKTIMASTVIVAIPRMVSIASKKNRESLVELNATAKEIFDTILTVLIPALVGIVVLAPNIVRILADESYIAAVIPLRMLAMALVFCIIAYFWAQGILYTFGQEKRVLIGTSISAVINVGLNLILIPFWAQNAAAFTTVISEGFTAVYFYLYGRKYMKIKGLPVTVAKICIGSCTIPAVAELVNVMSLPMLIGTFLTIIVSVIVYFMIEIILKNEAAYSVYKMIKAKIIK